MRGDKGHRRVTKRPSYLDSFSHAGEHFAKWHAGPTLEEQDEFDAAFRLHTELDALTKESRARRQRAE